MIEIFKKATKDKIIFNHLIHEDLISEGISIMCRQHHQLCQRMRILNDAFGFQQLTSIAVSVCNILFQTYYLYVILAENNITPLAIITPLIWTLDEMMEIQLLVTSCVEVCDNANSTAAILHDMRNNNFNISLEENVQTYSLQMLHQKIEFSAMGYFVIDYTLSYSIVGAVTTYLVIFIQFDQGSRKSVMVDTTTSSDDTFSLIANTTSSYAMNFH
ncbi:putative gustatory receptor 28b [Harmonia axyridis]|uniref:putative gustatory receptor 28b n=1 Tax=Harmonia axyridis TaxID=115357 RepID=UPI001E274E3D|nr:putative gustatory receptor 28b [Harmonia axyridis]